MSRALCERTKRTTINVFPTVPSYRIRRSICKTQQINYDRALRLRLAVARRSLLSPIGLSRSLQFVGGEILQKIDPFSVCKWIETRWRLSKFNINQRSFHASFAYRNNLIMDRVLTKLYPEKKTVCSTVSLEIAPKSNLMQRDCNLPIRLYIFPRVTGCKPQHRDLVGQPLTSFLKRNGVTGSKRLRLADAALRHALSFSLRERPKGAGKFTEAHKLGNGSLSVVTV